MIVDPKQYTKDVFDWADSIGLRQVRLIIHQPKLGGPTEDVVPLDDLEAFAKELHHKADRVRVADAQFHAEPFEKWWPIYLNPEPNDEDCAYCRARVSCPSMQAKLQRDALVDFQAISEAEEKPTAVALVEPLPAADLNRAMLLVPLMEDWCLAVRAELERRAMSGEVFEDFGLELGRQGNRAWVDPAAAEEMLRKTFRLSMEDVYKMDLKSPTQIEKLTKAAEGEKPTLTERKWVKLQQLVTRADAKPSVKLKSKIKVPWTPPVVSLVGFTPIVEAEDDLS